MKDAWVKIVTASFLILSALVLINNVNLLRHGKEPQRISMCD